MWWHSMKACGARRRCGGRRVAANWSHCCCSWAGRRRQDLLDVLDQLTPKVQELTRALEEEAERRPGTRRLMTHPGVGPLTALAFESDWNTRTLSLRQADCQLCRTGSVGRVQRRSPPTRAHQQTGQLAAAFLLVEAAQVTVRSQPQWRSKFFHLATRRGRKIAKVAMARKLAVHLYWMWRQGRDYGQFQKARFARGRARKSPWCAVNHRRNDWVSRSPAEGEFEVVIMIAVVIEEMDGSD